MSDAPRKKIEQVEFDAASDGASGSITFHTSYSEPFAFAITAEVLDGLIQKLGELRISLRPDVPTECPGGDWTIAVDPELFVSGAPGADPTLNVRSLRFGWQHFRLPRPLARQVSEALILAFS